jgi:hypothetical protein
MSKARGVLLLLLLTLVVLAIPVAHSHAGEGKERPSDKFDLAREIAGYPYALLHEESVVTSTWAGYALREEGDESQGRPCVYIGSVTRVASLVFFHPTSECGALWPGKSAIKPIFVAQRDIGSVGKYGEGRQGEAWGLLLVAKSAKSLRISFAGGTHIRVQTHLVPEAARRKARLPEMRYASYSVLRSRCIREVRAFGSSGMAIANAPFPQCG